MIAVVGEALVDLIPEEGSGWTRYRARPGGSPLNVAVALARLDVPVSFLGRLSTDQFGRLLRAHLEAEGVDVSATPSGPEPTAVALASVDEVGAATYRFWWEATADRHLSAEELPEVLDARALHVGSVASLLPPAADAVHRVVDREADRCLVSYDPNLRPSVTGDDDVRARVASLVGRAHLVKVSEQDLAWLAPDEDPITVVEEWRDAGPDLVVLTRGATGALAVTARVEVSVPSPTVTATDTVGAGDAFMAGLLAWLVDHDRLDREALAALVPHDLRSALRFAAAVAAATVTEPGADPPRRAELPT